MSAEPVSTKNPTTNESAEQVTRGIPVAEAVGEQVMPVQGGDGEETPRGGEGGEAMPGPGQAADGEELGGDPFGEDDVEEKRVSKDPGLPTQSERDDHCVDHTPYRSWCEDCVRGRALGEQHRARTHERTMPVVSFDYMFVTKGRVLRREELDGDDEDSVDLKILVVKDSKSKIVSAHVVDKKGTDASGYAVTRVVEDL